MNDQPVENFNQYLFAANFFATVFMVGLIWMVQVVHYPLFDDVGEQDYARYQERHQTNITYIVGPMMLIELITAVLMISYPVNTVSKSWLVLGLGLVIVIWLSTALIQVPCHSRLSAGFDQSAYQWLVRSNWIRTIAWTARGILLTAILVRSFDV